MLRKAFFIFFISSCGFCHSQVAEPQLFHEAEKTFGMAAKAPLQLDPTPAIVNDSGKDEQREKEYMPADSVEQAGLPVSSTDPAGTGDAAGLDIAEALLAPLEGILSCFGLPEALPVVEDGLVSVADTIVGAASDTHRIGDGHWLQDVGGALGDMMLSLMRMWSEQTNSAINFKY